MTYNLDEKDKKIIEILKDHGDYTTRQIAKKTLIPATTIHNRITKLKKEGVIKKFTIELDHKKIGTNRVIHILIDANLIWLKQHKQTQYDIAKKIRQFPEVERVDIVSGGADMMVIARCANIDDFDHFLVKRLQPIEGIKHTQSLIVLHEY